MTLILGGCAIPVFAKPSQKRGHDLFSQEKPEAVLQSQDKLMKDFSMKKIEERAEREKN